MHILWSASDNFNMDISNLIKIFNEIKSCFGLLLFCDIFGNLVKITSNWLLDPNIVPCLRGYYLNHYISFTKEQKVPVSDTTYYVIGQITHVTSLLLFHHQN